MKSERRGFSPGWTAGLLAGLLLFGVSCASVPRASRRQPDRVLTMEVTGYCPCGQCCGWRRNGLFRPVICSGPQQGQPKAVGRTASGTRARPGTIAADTRVLPFGTVLFVPGYGYGRVEDRGSDIQGNRLDLFFRRHAGAEQWGRKSLHVKIWYPLASSR
jgi:3D (Asp-Asp-Asp) domain-containing protein